MNTNKILQSTNHAVSFLIPTKKFKSILQHKNIYFTGSSRVDVEVQKLIRKSCTYLTNNREKNQQIISNSQKRPRI